MEAFLKLPVPSRPDISGNTGLNCHLSELISQIVEPIAYEQTSTEVNSTDDLLAWIEKIHEKVASNKLESCEPESSSVSDMSLVDELCQPIGEENDKDSKIFDGGKVHEQKTYCKSDIRSFGVVGERTNEKIVDKKERIRESINRLRDSRMKGSLLPNLSERMQASFVIDKLLDGETIKLPVKKLKKLTRKTLQKTSGMVIVGADVKSLFPSLRNVETARLAKKAILESDVEFCNWDFKKAMRCIYIIGGRQLVVKASLKKLCPKWLGEREDLIAVGGTKSKENTLWRDSNHLPLKSEEKKIVATVVELAVNLCMSTHIYTFAGRFFLQADGGPIGLRSTASLASLVMK